MTYILLILLTIEFLQHSVLKLEKQLKCCHFNNTVGHISRHLACCIHITWWRLTNNGEVDGRGIRYTKNNNTLHFNQISDEEKDCGFVTTTCMLFPTQKQWHMELCQKHLICYKKKKRNCNFAMNNHYGWNLDAWLQTQIEISEQNSEEKKFTEAAKILTSCFEGETNDDNGLRLYRCDCHVHCAIWSYSGPVCVCILPSQNFKDWSSADVFTNVWSCDHSPWQWSSMYCNISYCSFSEIRQVLNHSSYNPDLSAPNYDLFLKLKEPLGWIRFSDLSELSLTITQEIWWLNKNLLLHGIERQGDYIEGL